MSPYFATLLALTLAAWAVQTLVARANEMRWPAAFGFGFLLGGCMPWAVGLLVALAFSPFL